MKIERWFRITSRIPKHAGAVFFKRRRTRDDFICKVYRDHDDEARLIPAACYSYQVNCGPDAANAAEFDLLGAALNACQAAMDDLQGVGPDIDDLTAQDHKRMRQEQLRIILSLRSGGEVCTTGDPV